MLQNLPEAPSGHWSRPLGSNSWSPKVKQKDTHARHDAAQQFAATSLLAIAGQMAWVGWRLREAWPVPRIR